MSYIIVPDPHPGRCCNYRLGNAGNPSQRCLDYEGVPHVCTFPEPQTIRFDGWSRSTAVYTTPKPERWVKPS